MEGLFDVLVGAAADVDDVLLSSCPALFSLFLVLSPFTAAAAVVVPTAEVDSMLTMMLLSTKCCCCSCYLIVIDYDLWLPSFLCCQLLHTICTVSS